MILDKFLKGDGRGKAFFLAPMAGITHSAFRRLVSDFGGYDALFTEMIHGRAVLHRKNEESPFTKKRECEGDVIYQLLLTGEENLSAVIDNINSINPAGIDLNAACPAPEVQKYGSGFALFMDLPRFAKVLESLRKYWKGSLSVKCRLGFSSDHWEPHFFEALKIIRNSDIDFLTVHPRFAGEKLKRPARWDLIPEIKEHSKIPLIINGDIFSMEDVQTHPSTLGLADGYMIGRMAAVKPWIFNEFQGKNPIISYREVWSRFYDYAREDLPQEMLLQRVKDFTAYFARNFFFGQELFGQIQHVSDISTMRDRVMAFLGK